MAPLWIVGDTRWHATQDLAAARLPSRLMAVDVRVRRVYDPLERGDGYRLLIDHVWPRGISRDLAEVLRDG